MVALLIFGVSLVACLVVAVAVAVATEVRSRRLRSGLESAARRRGWTFHRRDPIHLLPVLLGKDAFQKPKRSAPGAKVQHVLRGDLDGIPLTMGEYDDGTRMSVFLLLLIRLPPLALLYGLVWGLFGDVGKHSFVIIETPLVSPGLQIIPDRRWTKLSMRARRQEVRMESHEFSQRYHVTAEDRRFAYDVLHPRAMEEMLRLPVMEWDWHGHMIVVSWRGRLLPARLNALAAAADMFHRHAPRHRIPEQGRWIRVGAPARSTFESGSAAQTAPPRRHIAGR